MKKKTYVPALTQVIRCQASQVIASSIEAGISQDTYSGDAGVKDEGIRAHNVWDDDWSR